MIEESLDAKSRKKEAKLFIPLSEENISAGFPSPAEDYLQEEIDLNEYLIANPASTFILRVNGNSMTKAGIQNDDLIIIDKSINPRPGNIVIASLDGNFTIKRLLEKDGEHYLKADQPNYPMIKISNQEQVEIWGVAIYSIHKIKRMYK